VARDRKRAKQRRGRRAGADGVRRPGESQPIRADVPGALEHASGDVDEFDAALVRGAGGVPGTGAPTSEAPAGETAASDAAIDTDNEAETLTEPEIEQEAEAEGELTEDERERIAGDGGARAATPEQASGAQLPRSGNRVVAFLRASWAELQRVQWPDRRQVFQATAVVLGFVIIAGLYLGLADFVAKEIVEVIL
jgi:preprotein translocase subunit SecE